MHNGADDEWWNQYYNEPLNLAEATRALPEYNNNNNNIGFFSQASWGRLEMKPERNKFKVQAH